MQKLAGIITESKINEVEEITPEKAADMVAANISKIENSPKIEDIANKIANDPKASKQLMDLLSKYGINPVSLNESIEDAAQKLSLILAKKAETIKEEDNYGGAFLAGLVGGGTLAHYLFSVTTADFVGGLTHSTAAMPETIMGAIIGAALAVIGKKVYDKVSGND